MKYIPSPQLLLGSFCLYWKNHNLLPKLIALNLFSLVVFAIIENTLFRYLAGMTFEESMKARGIAAIFNTAIGIAWPKIELFFKSKLSKHPIKFLRDKSEEFSLLCVKIAVNTCTYVLSGNYSFNLKLGIKVGVIVFISFYWADFLKYKLTPFVDQKIVNFFPKKDRDFLVDHEEPQFSETNLEKKEEVRENFI